MKITKTGTAGIDMIKSFEGFRSAPYKCPAGIPTIGYGATFYPDGKKEYYLFGFKYTKDEWMDRKREEKGVPPAKDPKYDTRF